jgi:hypothetical protein
VAAWVGAGRRRVACSRVRMQPPGRLRPAPGPRRGLPFRSVPSLTLAGFPGRRGLFPVPWWAQAAVLGPAISVKVYTRMIRLAGTSRSV